MDMLTLALDLFYFDNLIPIYALLFYVERVQSHCLYLLRFFLRLLTLVYAEVIRTWEWQRLFISLLMPLPQKGVDPYPQPYEEEFSFSVEQKSCHL